MKQRIFLVVLALMTALSMPVSATSLILNGYTDSDAKGVTLLITRKGASLSNLQEGEVIWIDQSSVKADGSFMLSLPLFADTEYDLHTNANSYSFVENGNKTLYVSASGSDSNSGESADAPLKTLAAAQERAAFAKEIILLDSATYTDASDAYQEPLTIRGNTGAEVLTLPAEVSLKGQLKLDNLKLSGASTIYANGYALEIGEGVTSTDRMNVYGGKKNAACESTDVKLYGGLYTYVYGGGHGGVVSGSTNVTVGGSFNAGDGIDDDASNISPCFVYGGGNNGAVLDSTNVTMTGNAVSYYLVGAGTGTNGTATNTNIHIQGGKVMNVYGGSQAVALTNCDTHITMTGGVAESLFGGCSSVPMTGNTYITVKGGEVLRRIYTGCYNNADPGFSLTWANTDNHVIGTTNLTLYPGAKLATKTGLSFTNTINSGVFLGSRRAGSSTDEVNTVIFADGSYASLSSKLGDSGAMYNSSFKSFENYTVNASAGGQVLPTKTGGKVKLAFGTGVEAIVGDVRYFDETEISLTKSAVTQVTFVGITSATMTETETGMDAQIGVSSNIAAKLIVAIYDQDGNMVSCRLASVYPQTMDYTLNLAADLKQDVNYTVKVLLWENFTDLKPMVSEYSLLLR